jgi:hypothetical protein
MKRASRIRATDDKVDRGLFSINLPTCIVSGGQTGVDRAALDVAIENGFEHGGWCPAGRLSENGKIPMRYQLKEHASRFYIDRTRQNVIDSDATLILYRNKLKGGTLQTLRFAKNLDKPHLAIDLERPSPVSKIREWLSLQSLPILNIAGPRESSDPKAAQLAYEVLKEVFQR